MFWEAQHPVSEQVTRRAGDHSRGEVNLNVRETEGENKGEKSSVLKCQQWRSFTCPTFAVLLLLKGIH